MTTQIRLSDPQFEFVTCADQFPAFVAGFGSGKTHAAVTRSLIKKLAYPGQNIAYYLPTFDLVRNIGFPRFAEMLEQHQVPYRINKSNAVIELENAGEIIFRTMDTPERIVGYEVADSLVDELDTLKPTQAKEVWNKIISRNRQKKPDGSLNTVGVATTPEGFRFVYERWKKTSAPGYRLIKASTYSNSRNLPEGYIDSLKASYPSNLLAAYLDGEFVNLTSGSVYAEFDRVKNATSETIKDGETLHIGMDFNVGQMAAVIFVMRDGDPHAVMEHVEILDTPAMAAVLRARYKDCGHSIMVYPDASGNSRKSNNASESDLAVLKQAGFQVCVNSRNPAVKDRVLSYNKMIHSEGIRRFRVNVDTCPHLVESLEKQAYDKNGEPDKSGGLDHVLDASGYFIVYKYPLIVRPAMSMNLRSATN
jgi:phage terminase large subunit